MQNEEKKLSGDRPLKNPDNDRLGYRSFAFNLSKAILEMTPVDGIVLSIYGPWVSGKTTLLNFIEHFLKKVQPMLHPKLYTSILGGFNRPLDMIVKVCLVSYFSDSSSLCCHFLKIHHAWCQHLLFYAK